MKDFLVDLDDRCFLSLGSLGSRHGMVLLSEVRLFTKTLTDWTDFPEETDPAPKVASNQKPFPSFLPKASLYRRFTTSSSSGNESSTRP